MYVLELISGFNNNHLSVLYVCKGPDLRGGLSPKVLLFRGGHFRALRGGGNP